MFGTSFQYFLSIYNFLIDSGNSTKSCAIILFSDIPNVFNFGGNFQYIGSHILLLDNSRYSTESGKFQCYSISSSNLLLIIHKVSNEGGNTKLLFMVLKLLFDRLRNVNAVHSLTHAGISFNSLLFIVNTSMIL